MGIIQSKADAFEEKKHAREEAALGPPSKTMGAFAVWNASSFSLAHFPLIHMYMQILHRCK